MDLIRCVEMNQNTNECTLLIFNTGSYAIILSHLTSSSILPTIPFCC